MLPVSYCEFHSSVFTVHWQTPLTFSCCPCGFITLVFWLTPGSGCCSEWTSPNIQSSSEQRYSQILLDPFVWVEYLRHFWCEHTLMRVWYTKKTLTDKCGKGRLSFDNHWWAVHVKWIVKGDTLPNKAVLCR